MYINYMAYGITFEFFWFAFIYICIYSVHMNMCVCVYVDICVFRFIWRPEGDVTVFVFSFIPLHFI